MSYAWTFLIKKKIQKDSENKKTTYTLKYKARYLTSSYQRRRFSSARCYNSNSLPTLIISKRGIMSRMRQMILGIWYDKTFLKMYIAEMFHQIVFMFDSNRSTRFFRYCFNRPFSQRAKLTPGASTEYFAAVTGVGSIKLWSWRGELKMWGACSIGPGNRNLVYPFA